MISIIYEVVGYEFSLSSSESYNICHCAFTSSPLTASFVYLDQNYHRTVLAAFASSLMIIIMMTTNVIPRTCMSFRWYRRPCLNAPHKVVVLMI